MQNLIKGVLFCVYQHGETGLPEFNTYMEEMFWQRSSLSPVVFPLVPVLGEDNSGKNFSSLDLLQYISLDEQVHVGGQSSIELR